MIVAVLALLVIVANAQPDKPTAFAGFPGFSGQAQQQPQQPFDFNRPPFPNFLRFPDNNQQFLSFPPVSTASSNPSAKFSPVDPRPALPDPRRSSFPQQGGSFPQEPSPLFPSAAFPVPKRVDFPVPGRPDTTFARLNTAGLQRPPVSPQRRFEDDDVTDTEIPDSPRAPPPGFSVKQTIPSFPQAPPLSSNNNNNNNNNNKLPFHPEFGYPYYADRNGYYFRVPAARLEPYLPKEQSVEDS